MLAAAFKSHPSPTQKQLRRLARETSLSMQQLETWFRKRRVLQAFVDVQPNMEPAAVRRMVVGQADAISL